MREPLGKPGGSRSVLRKKFPGVWKKPLRSGNNCAKIPEHDYAHLPTESQVPLLAGVGLLRMTRVEGINK